MRRFSKRKRTVRYLPDQSWASSAVGSRLSPNTSGGGELDLLQARGGWPSSLNASTVLLGNQERTDDDALIIDRISGKIFWDIEGNGGNVGDADAAGNWLFELRMAIFIRGTTPDTGTGAPDVPSVAGEAFGNALLNPGANHPVMLLGSLGQPDGWRVLWRRSWQVLVNFASGFGRDGIVSSEQSAIPGPWVHIKPKRILRPTEQLLLGYYSTAVGLVGAENPVRIWYNHDLRVAAHNTSRRR